MIWNETYILLNSDVKLRQKEYLVKSLSFLYYKKKSVEPIRIELGKLYFLVIYN